MALIQKFRVMAFAQVVLGIVAFCIASRNIGMLLVAGSLSAVAWYVTEGPAGRPLPRWLTNIGALAAVTWLLFDLFGRGGDNGSINMVLAMGHFTMWLQILLLYGEKSNREYAQVMVLSVLQMIAGSVVGISLVYGLLLAAYCVLAMMTVLLFHFKTTSDAVLAANRQAAPDPAWVHAPRPVVGQGHRWHLRAMTMFVALTCGAAAVLVFVVLPRSGEHRMPGSAATSRTESGFNTSVNARTSPGRGGGREPVLNVRFTMHGEDVGQDGWTWLLRGAAMDHYSPDTETWTRSRRVHHFDRTLAMSPAGLDLIDPAEVGGQVEGEFVLRQFSHNVLFTLHPVTHIKSDSLGQVSLNLLDQQLVSPASATAVIYTAAAPLAAPANLEQKYRDRLDNHYGASAPSTRWRGRRIRGELPRGPDGFAPAELNYATGWPVQRQRVASYTREVLAAAGMQRDGDAGPGDNDAELARELAAHLRREFRYTLDQPPTNASEDPVLDFLFNHRQGHCELFSSGLAAMARSIGMQARVVTGYVASEYNRIGGYYVVREANAHAWVEVYAGPEMGWRTIDPTPPADLASDHQSSQAWWAVFRQVFDHAEFAWLRSVVSFDQRSRKAMLESVQQSVAGRSGGEPTMAMRAWNFLRSLPEVWRLDRTSYTVAGILIVVIGVALGYLARLLMVRQQRLVALQLTALPRAQRRGLARRLRFYLTMLDMLERHGYVRPAWQSPFSFAQELAEANPLRFDPVVALTEIFYEIRFGHRELDAARRKHVHAHIKQLEHALANR